MGEIVEVGKEVGNGGTVGTSDGARVTGAAVGAGVGAGVIGASVGAGNGASVGGGIWVTQVYHENVL